jgi:hypothetical protein
MGDRKGRPYACSVALVGVALRGHPGDGTESVPYIKKQSLRFAATVPNRSGRAKLCVVGATLCGRPRVRDGTESVPYIRRQSFALLLQIKIEFARKDKNKIIY